jgi:deoxyribonuclease-1-like protein
MEGQMRRLVALLLLAAFIYGGWWFLQHYQIEGLQQVSLTPRATDSENPQPHTVQFGPPVIERSAGVVRIASFNIQVFGSSKLRKPKAMSVLAEIVRRFDVVAIQEIRSKSDDILPQFVELVNSTGRHYDFVIGPRLGRSNSTEQYAFVFDTASIEVDRTVLYTVSDPDDRLHREPLVGWFRVRGPPPERAFTFSLVGIHTDPDETDQELNALDDVYRAVRNDGRGEDDIILLGDLNVDEHHLGELGEIPGIVCTITGVPTNTRGTKTYDNMLFLQAATSEFTGQAGVLDMIREFNLTTDEALEVSDHMPIWAEFSIYEGGRLDGVAERPTTVR